MINRPASLLAKRAGKAKTIMAAVLIGGLSACSADLTGLLAGPPPAVYELGALSDIQAQGDLPLDVQVSIEEPMAAIAFDTLKIVVHVDDNEVQYLAGSRWADRAPRLMQQLIVETAENANLFAGVARQSVGLRSDYVVHGELREFGIFVNGEGAPKGEVVMTFKLVWPGNAQIVAHETFTGSAKAESESAADLVAAVDIAQKDAIQAAMLWLVENIRADVVARR